MKLQVLDASVIVSWLLEDENFGHAQQIESVLENASALVPMIWHIELRSALLSAERRGRITSNAFDDLLQNVSLIAVSTDHSVHLNAAVNLARKHRLSIYDAIYLELALRTGSDLATHDKGLAKAAQVEKCLSEISPVD